MDVMFLTMAATAGTVLAAGWKLLPSKLAPCHHEFRDAGESAVYRQRSDGRLTDTGITLSSSACQFEGQATFVLMPPLMRSMGVAVLDSKSSLRVSAITRWPSMKTVFVLDEK